MIDNTAMSGIETKIQARNADSELLGQEFKCTGNPEVGIEVVGLMIYFTTFDGEGRMVDDRSWNPLAGCTYRGATGECLKGGGYCRVAGAAPLAEYHRRVSQLKKLDKFDPSR